MTYLTHFLACIAGIWIGAGFAFWAVDVIPSSISKILNHSPDDKS